MNRIVATALGFSITMACTSIAYADDIVFPRPKNGVVVEETNVRHAVVSVDLTDSSGKRITGANGFPTPPRDIGTGSYLGGMPFGTSTSFDIPAFVNVATGSAAPPFFKRVEVVDVVQSITKIDSSTGSKFSGAMAETPTTSELRIEAVFFDDGSGTYKLGNIFGALHDSVGNAQVKIPDLFAEAGALDGNTLYSLVDLTVYARNIPTFYLGETFSIVDGVTSELPGMWFSANPFEFDPLLGWTSNGSPILGWGSGGARSAAGGFSGTATADALHGVHSVPEPSTWALMIIGFGAIGVGCRGARRNRARLAA